MCDGNSKCTCGKISEIHSSIAREMPKMEIEKPIKVADDEQVKACRVAVDAVPNNKQALLALGDALAFQMRYREALKFYEKARNLYPCDYEAHRKCAIRYMSIMEIEKSEKEFLWCGERTDDNLDIVYRLALCKFYKADFETAKQLFLKCLPLCANNDEMLIAVIYWLLICFVKLNESYEYALSLFSENIIAGHHVGYMQAVRLFAYDDASAVDAINSNDELNMSMYLYGLYNYYLAKGRKISAEIVFDDTIKLNKYFSSFAYLGAYSEKLRKEGKIL